MRREHGLRNIWRICAFLLTLMVGLGEAGQVFADSKPMIAKDARLAGDRERTRFIADLSKKVEVHAFALGDPYRVIIDVPDVSFQMPDGIGKEQRGLVTAYRFGLFAPGKSRIVLDIGGPFLIDKAFVLDPSDNQPARLVIDLVPTDAATFTAKLAESRAKTAASVADIRPPEPQVQPSRGKPVVVLDPGHGGVDPGTRGESGITEKEVVLTFAKILKAKLDAVGRYEIFLTREDDTFLPLRERVAFAQAKAAGLFLSIHADSVPKHPDLARGATLYTLSEQASDDEAKELAAKENFSDAIAGVELQDESDEVVANILLDLARRETQNRSVVFARSMVGELHEGRAGLHSKAMKSAGFRVLKAPDVPSVLLELGFLSNADDEKRLTSDAWQNSTADAIVAAIDTYFAKRLARIPY
ncbi:MAG: N-acetylmuramoyl-L-alanine amidase [Methyloceanibacter sp.]|uniref:N-acetylmuramoyl-L-alanine amidase n=1 Tax=Methyloceanibacter sp. TaxID=1965321 RepID=UPI003D9B3C94